MANGQIVPSRLGRGENGLGSDTNALFLKVFANEVLNAFEESNVMKELHTVRTISSGKSAQFPVTGIATAKYHTPGDDVFEDTATGYTSAIKHRERVISIDDVLIAATSVAQIDELKNHYDVRSTYTTELGRALAKRFDLATMRTFCAASAVNNAARSNPDAGEGNVIDLGGGASGVPADVSTAARIVEVFQVIAQSLDEKHVPSEDRFAVLTPQLYYRLTGSENLAINRDFGGSGSVASGKIPEILGIKVFSSPHISDIAIAAVDGDDSKSANNPWDDAQGTSETTGYLDATLANLQFIAGHKSAIGTVKLLDLAVESEYSMPKQSTLMLAKYAMGHGILRPDAAVMVTS